MVGKIILQLAVVTARMFTMELFIEFVLNLDSVQ